MSFRVLGLDPALFQELQALPDEVLAERGVERVRVDEKPGAPCRISLDDADIGEHVLLLTHLHQPAATPYRQQGPIFVRAADTRYDAVNAIPPALARRLLSLRGFSAQHMMVEADIVDGAYAAEVIARFFANPSVAYIHAHYARRGCFAATIERA